MRSGQLVLTGGLGSGLLLAALFPPASLAWLAPIALTPLLFALAHASAWRLRFAGGWLAGFLFWLLTCHWIRDTLAAYGGLTGPLSWLALLLFALVKGLHCGVFALLAAPMLRFWWAPPGIALLWAGLERTHGPLGFAWLTLGNAGADMAFPLRLAPITGVYGLSFLFALASVVLTLLLLRRGRRSSLWLLPAAGLALLPAPGLPSAPLEEAVALQTVLHAEFAWTEEEKDRAVRQLALLTLENALDPARPAPRVLLWPEAPAPFYYTLDPGFRGQMNELARLAGAPLIFSGVAYTPQDRPLNSAFVLTAEGRYAGRYDKIYLVPFGEFVPPGFGWIQKVSTEAGDFEAGDRLQPFPLPQGSFGVFICYESAFPHLVRRFAAGGAEVLVNLTNDGYFGRSAARPQHLLLARMRAVENARYLLRPTNDGITASIDPAGRVHGRIPEFERRATRLPYQRSRVVTIYTRYGDWFACSALTAGFALAALACLRERR